jgi:hypothetical protein
VAPQLSVDTLPVDGVAEFQSDGKVRKYWKLPELFASDVSKEVRARASPLLAQEIRFVEEIHGVLKRRFARVVQVLHREFAKRLEETLSHDKHATTRPARTLASLVGT